MVGRWMDGWLQQRSRERDEELLRHPHMVEAERGLGYVPPRKYYILMNQEWMS